MKTPGKRPTTSGSQAPPRSASSRKPSGIRRGATQPSINRRNEYFEIPTNRSGVFGEVIRPPPQNQNKENQQPANHQVTPPPNFNTRPQSNRPGTRGQWSRPGSMQSVRSYSRIPTRDGFNRSKTQGNFLPKHNSVEKFSANLQNTRDEEIGQIEPPRTAQSVRAQDDAITPRYPSGDQQYRQQQQLPQQQPQYQHSPQLQQQQPQQQYQQPQQQQRQQYQQHQQPQENYRIDVPPTPMQYEQASEDGESSHRPIQYPKAFPGRRYQPSQIVFH